MSFARAIPELLGWRSPLLELLGGLRLFEPEVRSVMFRGSLEEFAPCARMQSRPMQAFSRFSSLLSLSSGTLSLSGFGVLSLSGMIGVLSSSGMIGVLSLSGVASLSGGVGVSLSGVSRSSLLSPLAIAQRSFQGSSACSTTVQDIIVSPCKFLSTYCVPSKSPLIRFGFLVETLFFQRPSGKLLILKSLLLPVLSVDVRT